MRPAAVLLLLAGRDVSSTRDLECRDDVEHVKVSGQSSIKAVAGKLAHCIRRDDSVPTVLTIGAPSINLAVKVRL